ncbi:hypothetical protein MY11210_003852 [Beauveria gryllotalpidicola]
MSHTALIPDDFMVRWQGSKIRGTKAVRRPTTACQACRASKVKCEGKQRCRRCISRGIACVYPKPKSKLKSTDSGTNAAVEASTQHAHVPAVMDDQCVTWPPPPPPALTTGNTTQRATESSSSDDGLSLSQNFSGINRQTSFLDAHDLDNMVSQIDGALIAMEASTVYNTQFSGFNMQLNPSGAFDMAQSAAISECGTGTILPVLKDPGTGSRRLYDSSSNIPNGGVFL